MPRKKVFMVIAAVCWVAVLAFGPKTMTQQHQSTDKTKSAEKVSESSKEEKAKQDAAKAEDESTTAGEVNNGTETAPVPSTDAPANLNPQTPEPVVDENPVASPVIHYSLPKPIYPKFPPACGGCGRITQDNGLTIRCPMYEMSSSMVCTI